MSNIRCEGYHRSGGAFSFGPPEWRQCKNRAEFSITVSQSGEESTLPACKACLEESLNNENLEVLAHVLLEVTNEQRVS